MKKIRSNAYKKQNRILGQIQGFRLCLPGEEPADYEPEHIIVKAYKEAVKEGKASLWVNDDETLAAIRYEGKQTPIAKLTLKTGETQGKTKAEVYESKYRLPREPQWTEDGTTPIARLWKKFEKWQASVVTYPWKPSEEDYQRNKAFILNDGFVPFQDGFNPNIEDVKPLVLE